MSIASTLAGFVTSTRDGDLPQLALERAKMSLASTVASAAMGIGIPSAAAIRAIEKENGGAAQAAVWFDAGADGRSGTKLPAPSAARLNAVASDAAGRFVKPWRPVDTEGVKYQAALSWRTVKRLKDSLGMPLILKGIATAEDAVIAVEHGVEVIYVSNHGGRQLDHALGSTAVLPEILATVQGRAEVWVDGGYMRGSDVVKAIALGAKTVGLGRFACLGLAAAGPAGLVRALELLEEEVRICLGLLGVTSFAELTPRHVTAAPVVFEASVLSAFPLLDLYENGAPPVNR